jgi:glyoxylase-like metal-dependent hydrolase (beta-lactamase superfamily II)
MIPSADTVLEQAEEIDVGEPWFRVFRLPHTVYSIHEPKHEHGVISFLIVGSDKAVLFDTGMGIGDISNVAQQLTDLEIIVVNSHAHFDHVGDNFRFSKIFIYADEQAISRLERGWSNLELQHDISLESFLEEYPPGFDPARYRIRAINRKKISLLHDEDLLNLGNRTLEVLHTPGHSPDSISLLDRENRCLFTGDTFYPDWLFAFSDETGGASDLKEYAKTVKKLTSFAAELDYLYCSHTKALADPNILSEVLKALEIVIDGNETRHELIEMYGQELRLHHFDGFSILTKK